MPSSPDTHSFSWAPCATARACPPRRPCFRIPWSVPWATGKPKSCSCHARRLAFDPGKSGVGQNLVFARGEVLRRTVAETRAREAEITILSQKRFGILGKSLLEARPGMVNALTSLLGNADLILLSEDPFPDRCREHVRTIHTMALRSTKSFIGSLPSKMRWNSARENLTLRRPGDGARRRSQAPSGVRPSGNVCDS